MHLAPKYLLLENGHHLIFILYFYSLCNYAIRFYAKLIKCKNWNVLLSHISQNYTIAYNSIQYINLSPKINEIIHKIYGKPPMHHDGARRDEENGLEICYC